MSEDLLVGRCYTRARSLPLMVGRLPGSSGVLWGGPYTLTQLMVFAGGVLVLWWTHGLWAHLGTGWNAAILLGLPALLAWLVRHSRVDGRTPTRALLGIVSAVVAPPAGRLLVGVLRLGASRVRQGRFFVTGRPGLSVDSPTGVIR